ncbi:hypothetical protein Rleg5DRAFT_2119 [Rhizobium leguminosarum bv. viciae WSM1455]|nr:hypothetical protein Rleg5DRAFT_2119 [Rhizobium leguminosarum bv. viciae WSM1455]
MRKSLQFILVGLAAMTGLTISPTIAAAQDMELRIGPGGVGVYERDRYERYDRRGPRGCDPDDALDIARSEGLRRAQIVHVPAQHRRPWDDAPRTGTNGLCEPARLPGNLTAT